MRLRQIAPVVLILGATVVGFVAARALGNRDAQQESAHRAEIAATEIRGRVEQGVALVESLRRFMLTTVPGGITNEQFANLESQGLSAAGLPAAAWVERVSGSQRAAYERRVGPIVATNRSGVLVPVGRRAFYLPATLATRVAPMTVPGVDLGQEPGMAAAVARRRTLYRVTGTPLMTLRGGATGLFLLQSAQHVSDGIVEPGFATLFVPASWLLTSATGTAQGESALQLTIGGNSAGDLGGAQPARSAFTAVGQPFEVLVPRGSVHGAAALLPWMILAAGLLLAALAGALGVNGARRGKAQRELDRIFSLSPDLIAIAGFDGYFTRVNPAVGPILGYTEEEFLARPYLELVHPDDRERTETEASSIGRGKTTISFENRYLSKGGSYRWLEWTSAPAVEEGLMYGVARDVTERRRAESDLRAAEEQYRSLAQKQEGLRRVATLVARGASPESLFDVVAEEVARVVQVPVVSIVRYEADEGATELASFSESGERFAVGTRWSLDGTSVVAEVRESGRPARINDYTGLEGIIAETVRRAGLRSTVGVPVLVAGRLWGAMVVSSGELEPLPEGTETRLAGFTELVATAIANTESRAALGLLAEEQAALRRVATLVAEGVQPAKVFSALCEEVNLLLEAQTCVIVRLEADGTVTSVANAGVTTPELALGRRVMPLPGWVLTAALETGRSARRDDYGEASEGMSPVIRVLGIQSAVAVPIAVEGALWGVIIIGALRELFPEDTERRLEAFTELAATAIANAESRSELAASRARIVAASDETRRRIERDLHDGTQQRLVSLGLSLRLAESNVPSDLDEPRRAIGEVAAELDGVIDELREISRGIHPAILSEGGLGPALRTLARRSAIPVVLGHVVDHRLPEPVEVAAYYVVSEALTNATKHANASQVDVEAAARDGSLRLSICDDGVGGAEPAGGSGLVGLRDRVEALGGSIDLASPPGHGTQLVVRLPLELAVSVDSPQETWPAGVPANRRS